MNCPTCRAHVEPDQQYCRACGTALSDEQPQRVRPQMVILIAVIVTFLGIIGAIAGDMAGMKWAKFAGVLIALTGMFSIVAGSLIVEMLGPKKPARPIGAEPPAPNDLERADTTNKLLPVGDA